MKEEKEKDYSLVELKCTYKTHREEELRVVGNIDALGNWDVNKAIKMTNIYFPIWSTREYIKVPNNTEVEYKYLVYKYNEFHNWERLDTTKNRKIPSLQSYALVKKDHEGEVDGIIESFDPIEEFFNEKQLNFPFCMRRQSSRASLLTYNKVT